MHLPWNCFQFLFFLFAIALLLGNNWLVAKEAVSGTSFGDIFKLLLRAAVWFVVVIIIVALLSALISFLVFLWKKQKNGIRFSVTTNAAKDEIKNKPAQKIHIEISPLLKPLFGFIKIRLQYDGKQYSDKFALIQGNQKKLISLNYAGDYQWSLPEIKEYNVEKLIIYFEDMFQFFSFTFSKIL